MLAELLCLARGEPFRDVAEREALDVLAEFVQLVDVISGQSYDSGSPERVDRDESLCLQLAQSGTDGDPAHTERLGDAFLIEVIARAEDPAEDRLPHECDRDLL